MITTQGIIKLLDFGFSSFNQGERGCTLAYLSPEGWEGKELSHFSDLFSLGLIRKELQEGMAEQHSSKEQWRARSLSLCNKNQLLRTEPKQRQCVDIESKSDLRNELGQLVVKTQNKKKHLSFTTKLIKTIGSPSYRLKIKKMLVQPIFFFTMLFYNSTLQPSQILIANKSVFAKVKLDVRSHQWRQVKLYQGSGEKWHFLRQAYTPVVFKGLRPGQYQLAWRGAKKSGTILVQLKENKRILIE